MTDLHVKATQIAELVEEKGQSYGNAAVKLPELLKILYGDSIPKSKYVDLHFVVRILDKLSRIASGQIDAFNESPWIDVCGYALLRLTLEEDE